MFFVNSRIFFKIIWFLYDNDPRHERVKCNRHTDNSNDFYFFLSWREQAHDNK